MFKSNYIYETSLQKQSKEDDYNGNNSNEQVRACVWDSNFHFSEKKIIEVNCFKAVEHNKLLSILLLSAW